MNKNLEQFLKQNYEISDKVIEINDKVEEQIAAHISEIDQTAQLNQYKVLKAMQKNKLSDTHFLGTTGYGYGDSGREMIDKIYSEIFETEDAYVRHNFISGTHALSTALFGLLRTGDTLLAVTGKPYDTLDKTIGLAGQGYGSLKEYGIGYEQVDLLEDGTVDFEALKEKLQNDKSIRVAEIQRSKGYAWRNSFCISDLEKIISFIKDIRPDVICFVDNCYGEFAETKEPTQVGADICVGSLIKNAGGGISQTGGYVAGKAELIEKISYRLTAPGLGKECGATFDFNRGILQGLFMAPHTVANSIKGAIYTAKFFELLGYEVAPASDTRRTDIVQSIKFNDEKKLIAFCQAIQAASPVDSHVLPMPWDMPGYQNQVIMAAGTFVQGASIELSVDAPIRPPYIAYMQGGLTYDHVKIGVMRAVQEILGND